MPWRHMGEWRYSSTILYLGTTWNWLVSFTSLPLYPQVNNPLYPLDRRLGGLQSRSGRCGEEENLSLPWTELGTSSPSLYRLSYQVPSSAAFWRPLNFSRVAEISEKVSNILSYLYLLPSFHSYSFPVLVCLCYRHSCLSHPAYIAQNGRMIKELARRKRDTHGRNFWDLKPGPKKKGKVVPVLN
jgi:hypothetical protein